MYSQIRKNLVSNNETGISWEENYSLGEIFHEGEIIQGGQSPEGDLSRGEFVQGGNCPEGNKSLSELSRGKMSRGEDVLHSTNYLIK